MSIRHLTLAVAAGCALAVAGTAQAGVVAAVDFGLTTSPALETVPSPNGGTWQAWNLTSSANSAPSMTFGAITLTIPGSPQARNRNAPSDYPPNFTYGNLLRDLVSYLNRGSTGATVSLEISGLTPNTPYAIRVWSQDNQYNGGAAYTWYDTTTGSASLLGTITNKTGVGAADLPDNLAFSVKFMSTSDANGTIKLAETDSLGLGSLNAIEIATVPEPASLGLLAVGGLALLRRRQR